MPVYPTFFKNPRRDMNLVVLAGLLANIVLAVLGGLVIRAGVTGELGTFARAWLIVNAFMFGFQLMPLPGRDGAKLLAPFLPPRPREVYVNGEQYLVLFILVIFFILSGPLLSIVDTFANAACNLESAADLLLCQLPERVVQGAIIGRIVSDAATCSDRTKIFSGIQ